MNLGLRAMSWVTPLGNGLEEVMDRLAAGEVAQAAPCPDAPGDGPRYYIPVASDARGPLSRIPRVRRSGAISYHALTAGLAALEAGGVEPLSPLAPAVAQRTAIVFAICSGGVQYTRRLYEKIVQGGPPAASPLLFPETVYNAPASHLAATLGVEGESYTLVGDSTVGLAALEFAGELLACQPGLEQCLVVGCEECDWILWEGYQSWRLCSREPSVSLEPPRGMLLSEGAAALLVGRTGTGRVDLSISTGTHGQRRDAGMRLRECLNRLAPTSCDLLVGSANGTWIGPIEHAALAPCFPEARWLTPKAALGESLAASSLIQTIFAAQAVIGGSAKAAAVSAIGLNQQVGAAFVHPLSSPVS